MGRKVVEARIGNLTVRTESHPPLRGLTLRGRLLKILAPVLSKLPENVSLEQLMSSNVSALGPALGALFEQIQPAELPDLCWEILAFTTVTVPDDKGTPVIFTFADRRMIDLAFGGPNAGDFDLELTCAHALKANFSGLFQAAGSGVGSSALPATATSLSR